MIKQLSVMVLTLSVSFSALAISESYRHQLERSGCTQVTDGNGCDIHKSKAQNAEAAKKAARFSPSLDQISSEADAVINKPFSAANDDLLAKGWRSGPGVDEYQKGPWKMRVIVEHGKIANAQIFK